MTGYIVATILFLVGNQLVIAQQNSIQPDPQWQNWRIQQAPGRTNLRAPAMVSHDYERQFIQPVYNVMSIDQLNQHALKPINFGEQHQYQQVRPVQQLTIREEPTWKPQEQPQYQPFMPVQQPVLREEQVWKPQEPAQQYQLNREDQPWMVQQPIRTENQVPNLPSPKPIVPNPPQLSYQSWQQNAQQQPGFNVKPQIPPQTLQQQPLPSTMDNGAVIQNFPQLPQKPPQLTVKPTRPVEIPSSSQFQQPQRPVHQPEPQKPQQYQQQQQPQYRPPQQFNREDNSAEETYVVVPGVVDVRCPRNDDPKNPVHFPMRGNCQKFVKCYAGRAFEMDCPRGLDFDAKANRCDYPAEAHCTGY